LPFSDAVLAGDTLFISGRIGIDPSTGMAPAELEQELPARAFVGSGPLLKGGRFEMMGIAMRQARQ